MKTTALLLNSFHKLIITATCFLMLLVAQVSAQTDTCKVPWIPPQFSVTETHWDVPTSFWQNGGHVPANTIDEDTTNYARAHIKASGSATLRISDLDSVYSPQFVGFYIKSRAFRDADFSGVTIRTYLDGVLMEERHDDELWVEYIPQYVNDPICIGFFASTSWNEIEVMFDRGPRVHYDVFYAVLMGQCAPPQGELPPALPVTWISFEAQKKGEASDLKWATAQEFNNAGYQVERSTDGRLFQTLGNVAPSITPRDINTYSYTDLNPFRGMNYYRIKQIDTDGKINYSTVKSISFNSVPLSVRTWPNPVTDQLNIEMPGVSAFGDIQLVNSSGVVVMKQNVSDGMQHTSMDISYIDAGIYSLIITSGEERQVQRIVVIK